MPKVVNHDARREEVAEATWRVIAKHGVDGATLREIAREAGFTTGVIHHYFRDRGELMAFAYELIAEQTAERLTETLADLPAGMPRVRATIEALVPRELKSGRVAALIGFWSSAAVMVGRAVLAAFLFKRRPGEEPDPEHAVTAATAHPVSVGSLPRGDDR